MSNAAIAFYADAYDAVSGKLMGRQAAGESFLRGYLRHAEVDRFTFWRGDTRPVEEAEALIARIQPTTKPIEWIQRGNFARLGQIGCLFAPAPANAQDAWTRRLLGSKAYSVTGIIHTISSGWIQDALAQLLLAPVEPWDALICTSRAGKGVIETQLDCLYEHLQTRLGATRRPPVRLETIPLGVNSDEFSRSPEHRKAWRERLGIPDDGVAALYVGRFSAHAKMHPIPMAAALERAAQRTGRPVHWIVYGQAADGLNEKFFIDPMQAYAPSVTLHVLDGSKLDWRAELWSAADFFLSLSDNIQETFGLTPLEAMAAGLPTVVSDWDGYKDTVRHGVDGFRIRTHTPKPAMGADLALRHALQWDSYDAYIGQTAQFCAVDVDEAADAIARLVEDPELRARMGAAGQARARAEFDWRVIVPRYEALWAELGAIRLAAPPSPQPVDNPWRMDPFTLFGNYPTGWTTGDTPVLATEHATEEAALALLKSPSVAYARPSLPNPAELTTLIQRLRAGGATTVDRAVAFAPPGRRPVLARSLTWLAKYGLVKLDDRTSVGG